MLSCRFVIWNFFEMIIFEWKNDKWYISMRIFVSARKQSAPDLFSSNFPSSSSCFHLLYTPKVFLSIFHPFRLSAPHFRRSFSVCLQMAKVYCVGFRAVDTFTRIEHVWFQSSTLLMRNSQNADLKITDSKKKLYTYLNWQLTFCTDII